MTRIVDRHAVLERFGEGIRRFLLGTNKAEHHSGMFDLRRRTLLGVYAYYDHLPWTLRHIAESGVSPEDIGRRGRGLCGEPFGAQIHGILWAYLLARENEIALGNTVDDGELAVVVDWWAAAMSAYRESDALLPFEDANRQRATTDDVVRRALSDHEEPAVSRSDVFRVTSSLQVYNFVLRGEQRGTTNFHGPYASRRPGHSLFVEEFTRLRRDVLPWSRGRESQPMDRLCAIFEVEDVSLRFDLFQGMSATPADWQSRVRRAVLLCCDDGGMRVPNPDERSAIVEACRREQARLFREMMVWDDDFKVDYGVHHYLDFLQPFLDAGGLGDDIRAEARERFEATARRRRAEIRSTDAPVWQRMFSSPRIFSPIKESYRYG